jgi:hypothetical protein
MDPYKAWLREVLQLAGEIYFRRVEAELWKFAEALDQWLHELFAHPRPDWRESFDALLAQQESEGRLIEPKSRHDLLDFLEDWSKAVDWRTMQNDTRGDSNDYRYGERIPTNAPDSSGLAERPNQIHGQDITWLDPTWYSKGRHDGRVIGYYTSERGTWYKVWWDRKGTAVEWVDGQLIELDSHPPDIGEPLRISRADAIAVTTMGMPIAMVYNTGRIAAYEVGTAEALYARSIVGDNVAIHHVGQAHALEQLVPGYLRSTGPAIALPTAEHTAIPALRGAINLTPQQVLARDIWNLRNYTNTPNSSLQQLIELNKQMYPGAFVK